MQLLPLAKESGVSISNTAVLLKFPASPSSQPGGVIHVVKLQYFRNVPAVSLPLIGLKGPNDVAIVTIGQIAEKARLQTQKEWHRDYVSQRSASACYCSIRQ